MPPPSPVPGWASGDVCRERTARARTGVTLPTVAGVAPRLRRAPAAAVGVAVAVLAAEGGHDVDEAALLVVGEGAVGEDGVDQVAFVEALLQDARPHVEGLGGDAEGLGRGVAHAPFDLAQVGVGDARQLRQPAQGQPGQGSLLADELPQLPPAVGDVHGIAQPGDGRQGAAVLAGTAVPPGGRPPSGGFTAGVGAGRHRSRLSTLASPVWYRRITSPWSRSRRSWRPRRLSDTSLSRRCRSSLMACRSPSETSLTAPIRSGGAMASSSVVASGPTSLGAIRVGRRPSPGAWTLSDRMPGRSSTSDPALPAAPAWRRLRSASTMSRRPW